MPKPVLPEGLFASMRVGTAARSIIAAKADEVACYIRPAMKGSFDGIHDMRVAVKRMREALRLFRRLMRKRRRMAVIPLVQKLNDSLGVVREHDVLMHDAGRVAKDIPEAADLLSGLIEVTSSQRDRAHDAVLGVWNSISDESDFLDLVLRAGRSAHKRNRPINEVRLDLFAYVAIRSRANSVMARLAEARGSDDAVRLHMLRITVKKLKYIIEPFLPLFPAVIGSYDVVADIQESLGLTHDLDVLISAFEEHLVAVAATDDPAARAAVSAMVDRRDALYLEARDHIDKLDGQAWHHDLLDSID